MSDQIQRTSSDWQTIRRLLRYLDGQGRILTGVFIALIFFTLGQAYGPTLIGRAIDEFITIGDRAGLARTMLLLFAVYVVSWLGFVAQIRLMGILAQRVLKRLRGDIFGHLQKLSLSYFHDHEAGDLMSRLINDTDAIGTLFSQSLVQSLGSFFSLFAVLFAMFALNVQLALVTFLILPVMILVTIYFSRRSRVAYRRTREALGQLSADLEEELSLVRESQSFARTALDVAEFEVDNAANRDANVYAASITAAFSPTIDVLSTLATVLVAGFGGYLAITTDVVTVGIVVAFLAYAQQFFRPVQMMAQLYTQLQSTLAASDRVFELLDTAPTITNQPGATDLPPAEGLVEFENVAFSYVEGKRILDGLTLTAQPGETIALVGETGAGKSTVVNLIGRFYDVDAGVVKVDGYDVRDVTVNSLRQQLGEVPQSSFLFPGTIAENIRYGRPEARDNEVKAAAKAARAHEFVAQLPDGYETQLGGSGANVSQGQRQLLCIARAILADPRLLLLDEATSNIDTRTERLVQEAIDELLEGRTAFVIAHRLSTIRHADKIVVVGDGGIIEEGSHDQLMAAAGAYAKLVNEQSGENLA